MQSNVEPSSHTAPQSDAALPESVVAHLREVLRIQRFLDSDLSPELRAFLSKDQAKRAVAAALALAPLLPPAAEEDEEGDVGDGPRERPLPRLPDVVVVRRGAERRVRTGHEGSAAPPPPPDASTWRPMLDDILGTLVPASDPARELERIHRAALSCDDWRPLPNDVQRGVLSLLGARLRHLQDEVGMVDPRLNECFTSLTRYSADARPGFVFGLARSHTPRYDTWADDAEVFWDRLQADHASDDGPPHPVRDKILADLGRLVEEIQLAPEEARAAVAKQTVQKLRQALEAGVSSRNRRLVAMCVPLADRLDGREFSVLRKAIRELTDADAEADAEAAEGLDTKPVPDDWAWARYTRNKNGVLVGGSVREAPRERLQTAFGFAQLDWVGLEARRLPLIELRDRILSGKVHLVLLLRQYVGAETDDVIIPACRARNVPYVHVHHGYGITRVRGAIERSLELSLEE